MKPVDNIISQLIEDITAACDPAWIFLISNKYNTRQELTSFKLCVVVQDVPSTAELEAELYMKTDCPIPFDILIYNRSEWEELVEDDDTFAAKIQNTGVILYGEN